jgi:protein O-mannosyl-transferase
MPNTDKPTNPPKTETGVRQIAQYAVVLLLIGAITAVTYLSVVDHQFCNWDDGKHVEAIWPPSWETALRVVADLDLKHTRVAYYSPVHFLSLMLDQALMGPKKAPEAWISKVSNVAFHAVNAALVFCLLILMGMGRISAVIGSLLFALHPLQVETVAWVAERKNLLCAFCYLWAMILCICFLRTGRVWYVVPVFFLTLAGLLSKPAAVTLPVALILLGLVYGRKPGGLLVPAIGLAALFALCLGWSLFVLATERTYPAILPPLVYRPLIAAGAIWFYLWKFLVPVDLAVVYPRWDVVGDYLLFTLPLLALGGSAILLALHWRRVDKCVLWGICFFVLNLLPVCGLVPFGYMVHSFVADHFVYLPMVGLCAVVAGIVDRAKSRLSPNATKVLLGAVCLWISVLGIVSVRQISHWKDSAALWEATLRVNRTSPGVYNNYGLVLLDKGDYEGALTMFNKAVELAPRFDTAFYNAGKAYFHLGERQQAREMYTKAMELNSVNESARFMLAELMREEGNNEQAIEFLKTSVSKVPDSATLRSQLGGLYYKLGREEEALEQFNQALRLDPNFLEALMHKGSIMLSLGRPEEAIETAERAARLVSNAEVHHLLAAGYAGKGRFTDALPHFVEALRLNPAIEGLSDNFANALVDAGSPLAAEKYCSQVPKTGHPCSKETLARIIEVLGHKRKP